MDYRTKTMAISFSCKCLFCTITEKTGTYSTNQQLTSG